MSKRTPHVKIEDVSSLEEPFAPSPLSSPGKSPGGATDNGSTLNVSPTLDSPGTSTSTSAGSPPTRRGKNASDKEKRKRSRVTPEQLVHLERFFSVDRSPTAARRREISEVLGMQERQTQIWFQNRRAKAKLLDGKAKSQASAPVPPENPPDLRPGYQAELHSLIHEDTPVTIIPCSDLSIGTWRRIATVGKHDLVAYMCSQKRCLIWFIYSMGYGFKMEIPFDIIVNTEFTNDAPGHGRASFYLSQPPLFYLEHDTSSTTRTWKRCADWTEGMQATKVLRHDLTGSAVQLAHILRTLTPNAASDIHLHRPAYLGRPMPRPPTVIDVTPTPIASGLSAPEQSYPSHSQPQYSTRSMTDQMQQMPMMGLQEREYASAATLSMTPTADETASYDLEPAASHHHPHPHSHSTPSPGSYATSYSQLVHPIPSRSISAGEYAASASMYDQYPTTSQARHSPLESDYGSVPVPQAYGVDTTQYMSDRTDSTPSYMSDRPDTAHSQYSATSTSVVTTPYYPSPMQGSLSNQHQHHVVDQSYMTASATMHHYTTQDRHAC